MTRCIADVRGGLYALGGSASLGRSASLGGSAQVPSASVAPAESGGLERQLAAERTMVHSVILGILIALPITIALAIGMMALAMSDKASWYVWIGLGAGIGAYAALFFGTWGGVVYSTHKFDQLDEEAMHSRENESEGSRK